MYFTVSMLMIQLGLCWYCPSYQAMPHIPGPKH